LGLCESCWKKQWRRKTGLLTKAKYIGGLTCPKCSKKGYVIKHRETNPKTGSSWIWYSVYHIKYSAARYQRLVARRGWRAAEGKAATLKYCCPISKAQVLKQGLTP